MTKLFDIQDTTVAITDLTLTKTHGNVLHSDNYDIAGDLTVAGSITVDTLNVTNLVTENGSLSSVGNWIYNTEAELNGKGFSWTYGLGATQLIYRTGNRLWTNGIIDIAATASYNIDNIPVLSAGHLGSSITKSNLNSVGTLTNLNVSGDVEIGEFVFFNTSFNRIGIGTNEPNGSLSILDNNVELILGSPSVNLGQIGTFSSHDLTIVTDNLARITVKKTGDVEFAGDVTISGILTASKVITDNRIDRTHPLQFSSTKDTSVYGLGLLWTGSGTTKQLIMSAGPDRIWSSESLDLAENQCYNINGQPVISSNSLGPTILSSSLTQLGTLSDLTVAGSAVFESTISFNNGISLDHAGMSSVGTLALTVQNKEIVYGDNTQINIGDASLQTKPVKVFGPLSVNINNPDPSLQFAVNGDVSLGGKRFTNGTVAPTTGTYQVGDICWNTAPQLNHYVGWVCVVEGSPGQWLGFGMIANQ